MNIIDILKRIEAEAVAAFQRGEHDVMNALHQDAAKVVEGSTVAITPNPADGTITVVGGEPATTEPAAEEKPEVRKGSAGQAIL